MAMGNTRALFMRDLAVFVCRVPLMAIGIVAFGLTGLLLARAAASTLGLVLNVQLARKTIDLRYSVLWAGLWRPLLSTGGMIVAVLLLRAWWDADAAALPHLLAEIFVGALIYLASLAVLWLLSRRPAGLEADLLALIGRLRQRRNRGGLVATLDKHDGMPIGGE
jgi:lipopolysaccharide exporter